MSSIKLYLISLFLICLSVGSIQAQENDSSMHTKNRIGFIYGYGTQEIALNVNYFYEVHFFQAQYYYNFFSRRTWQFDLLAQPQYNLTEYRRTNTDLEKLNGYELGVNLGILFRKNISHDLLSLYTLLSIGPHYVSGTPNRQAKGFIFSDNVFIGMNINLLRETYLDLRLGYRHISNANLKSPNGGVDNIIFSGGFLINLD